MCRYGTTRYICACEIIDGYPEAACAITRNGRACSRKPTYSNSRAPSKEKCPWCRVSDVHYSVENMTLQNMPDYMLHFDSCRACRRGAELDPQWDYLQHVNANYDEYVMKIQLHAARKRAAEIAAQHAAALEEARHSLDNLSICSTLFEVDGGTDDEICIDIRNLYLSDDSD